MVPLSSANAIPEVTLNPRVVHGVEGKPGTFPYLAALLETTELQQKGAFRSQFCGATLTSSTTLVTAAHCVVDQKTGERSSASDITAGFTRSLDSENIRLVGVSMVSVHPDYDIETSRNDIAVLTLASAVTDIAPLQPLTPEFAAEYTASGGATQIRVGATWLLQAINSRPFSVLVTSQFSRMLRAGEENVMKLMASRLVGSIAAM